MHPARCIKAQSRNPQYVTGHNPEIKPGKMFMVTLPFFVISCVLLVLLSLYPSLSLVLIK